MNVKLIILFGSKATQTSGAKSDTDIAVLGDGPLTLDDKANLTEKLAESLRISEENIDLIDLAIASPLLQYQIAQNGQLIKGEDSDFVRFKVLAWKRYQDTAKLRRIREQVLIK